MTFQELAQRATEIREKYRQQEVSRLGRAWTREDMAQGLVVDVGELTELIMAKKGLRTVDGDLDAKLRHELADCLWSIIVLANAYGIDLEQAFTETMDQLDQRFRSTAGGQTE